MQNNSFFQVNRSSTGTGEVTKSFMANVFMWMASALAISAITAWMFGLDPALKSYLINPVTHGMTGLGMVVTFAPIALVLVMSFGMNRLSYTALVGLFMAYSLLMGMSLSFIFSIYTTGSIIGVFGITGGMFATMALLGYTTKTDLTKLGSMLMMALIGIIIASVVNMFMRSPGLDYAISFIAVILFTGLTAYDVQKLKEIGMQVGSEGTTAGKVAIMGALNLYLDFINLFLALLRFFGKRE